MACKVCGANIQAANSFCVSCGAPTEVSAEPIATRPVPPSTLPPEPLAVQASAPQKRRTLAAIVIAALVFGGGGIAAFQQWNENRLERLAQEGVVEAFGEGVLSDAVTNCVAIRNVVEDIPEQRIAAYADSLQGITDPRQALATAQTADFPSSAYLPDYEEGVSRELLTGFRALLRGSDRDDIAQPRQIELWETEWSAFALDQCGSSAQYRDNVSILGDADKTLDRVRDLAANAPWYPEGFSEYSANLAYRWSTQEGGSPCRNCSYWKMTVVTNTGCTSGLYGQINILRNGSAVDWTNDLIAYVAPGGSAVMTYIRYPYNSELQGQLVELSCY